MSHTTCWEVVFVMPDVSQGKNHINKADGFERFYVHRLSMWQRLIVHTSAAADFSRRKKPRNPVLVSILVRHSLILISVGWPICRSLFYITNYCNAHVRRGFNFKTTLTKFIPQHGTHPPQSCYCRRKRLWKDIPS